MDIPNYKKNVYSNKENRYCLLIPVWNESIRFRNQLEKMLDLEIHKVVDIIICDAGSTDGSNDEDMLKKHKINTLLTRIGNGKYSTDLRMGYDFALQRGYKGCITIDGNDKDDSKSVIDFINKLDEGYDYIQGSRFIKGGVAINTPKIRYLALKLINEPIMSFCAGRRLTDTTNGFRAYSEKFLTNKKVSLFREIFYGYELIYYLPIRACELGFNVIEIPVIRKYPKGEIPSKVGGIKGNIYQLSILFHILMKDYNPKGVI